MSVVAFASSAIVGGAALLAALAFPRAPTWQITSMRYKTLRMNTDFTAEGRVDMGLELYNPNYVAADIRNITLVMKHEDTAGHEGAFAVVRVKGDFKLPARSSRTAQSVVHVEHMPMSMAWALMQDMNKHDGVVKTTAHSYMSVGVMGMVVQLEAECIQLIQANVFPMQIVKIDCDYYYGQTPVPTLATGAIGSPD